MSFRTLIRQYNAFYGTGNSSHCCATLSANTYVVKPTPALCTMIPPPKATPILPLTVPQQHTHTQKLEIGMFLCVMCSCICGTPGVDERYWSSPSTDDEGDEASSLCISCANGDGKSQATVEHRGLYRSTRMLLTKCQFLFFQQRVLPTPLFHGMWTRTSCTVQPSIGSISPNAFRASKWQPEVCSM